MLEYGEPISIEVLPEIPTKYPTIDDLVDVPKTFANKIIKSIKNEGLYKRYGVKPSKSFLINGLPGTGKTFTMKALNNTINNDLTGFITTPEDVREAIDLFDVKFVKYDVGEYGTAFINRGSRIIQTFFDKAFQYSLDSPVVIEIDEADAILSSRSLDTHSEDRKNLETLMKNLQVANDTDGIYVVLMTNLKKYIDPAVLRAGRIDKHYIFPLPDENARKELFQHIIDTKNKNANYKIIRKYDLNKLSKLTDNFSYADISSVIEKSLENKVEEFIDKRKQLKADYRGFITEKGLEEEIEKHKNEFGIESGSDSKFII